MPLTSRATPFLTTVTAPLRLVPPIRWMASAALSAGLARGVGDAAQRQRQAVAHLLGDGQDLRLLRRQLERRGLADDDLLAVLLLDGLIDGEDADVVEDGLGQVLRCRRRLPRSAPGGS